MVASRLAISTRGRKDVKATGRIGGKGGTASKVCDT